MARVRLHDGSVAMLDSFTDFEDLRLTADGQDYRFSYSKMFGPMFIGKTGREVAWRPPNGCRFWTALHWWHLQGHRVVDGRCVYDESPKEHWWTPDGKNFVLDTPANRLKWAAFVIPGREQAITSEAE